MNKIKLFYLFLLCSSLSIYSVDQTESNNSAIVDFTAIIPDFRIVSIENPENFFVKEVTDSQIKLASAINWNEIRVGFMTILEREGVNLFSLDDVPFYPTQLKAPDYRIATVLRNPVLKSEIRGNRTNQNLQLFNFSMDFDWTLYDVRNNIELIKFSHHSTINEFVPGRYNYDYFVRDKYPDMIINLVFQSFQIFVMQHKLFDLFELDPDNEFEKMKNNGLASLKFYNLMWSAFSQKTRETYLDVMLSYWKFKEMLIDEYARLKNSRTEYISEHRKKQIDIIRESEKSIFNVLADGKTAKGFFIESPRIVIVAGVEEAEEYFLVLKNGRKVKGFSKYYNDEYKVSFIEFPVVNKTFLRLSMLDKDSNSRFFIKSDILNLYKWEDEVDFEGFSETDIYGSTTYDRDSLHIPFSDGRKIDSALVGSPVFDYFGNLAGIVTSHKQDGVEKTVIAGSRLFVQAFAPAEGYFSGARKKGK